MKLSLALWILVMLVPHAARADEEMSPYPHVAVGEGGRFYVRVRPDAKRPGDVDKVGSVAMYAASDETKLTPIWTVTGFYAFRVFLSADGRYLVRLGNWPRGYAPAKDHLAIAFYADGKLLKSYSTRDLIKDDAKVVPSKSHYEFARSVPGFATGSTRFTLVTVDGITYELEATTGAIVKPTR